SGVECKTFVIHAPGHFPEEKVIEEQLLVLSELSSFVKEIGCILLLENGGEETSLIKEVFSKINNAGFCLDTGHANLFPDGSHSIELIEAFSGKLKHLHLHDNTGNPLSSYDFGFDLHLPPTLGNVNFKEIFAKLKEVNYSGNFTLELFHQMLFFREHWRKFGLGRVRELLI
ncbi:MAG: sugar phosphate isomerase/epimerase, partial [archaeon]